MSLSASNLSIYHTAFPLILLRNKTSTCSISYPILLLLQLSRFSLINTNGIAFTLFCLCFPIYCVGKENCFGSIFTANASQENPLHFPLHPPQAKEVREIFTAIFKSQKIVFTFFSPGDLFPPSAGLHPQRHGL